MARKRKRDDAELSAEERSRRAEQREQQQRALAARAAGEHFEGQHRTLFPKRKPLEARREEARKTKRKAASAASRRSAQKALRESRAAAPDVVVVPIFWKGESKQMARVLSACADIEAALKETETERKVVLDTGHKYTPGQKFAHWEHKGVQLRIEVGPREAEKGWCTVARTFTAGQPAHRVQRVPVGAQSLDAELKKLQALVPEEDEHGPTGWGVAPQREADGEDGEDEEDEEHQQQQQQQPPRPKPARSGGDDLEDDFGDGAAAEPLPDPPAKKPKPGKASKKESGSASSAGRKKTVTF